MLLFLSRSRLLYYNGSSNGVIDLPVQLSWRIYRRGMRGNKIPPPTPHWMFQKRAIFANFPATDRDWASQLTAWELKLNWTERMIENGKDCRVSCTCTPYIQGLVLVVRMRKKENPENPPNQCTLCTSIQIHISIQIQRSRTSGRLRRCICWILPCTLYW